MSVIGLSDDEKNNLLRTVASVLHFGNIEFTQSRRSEYADTASNEDIEKVAFLLGIPATDLSRSLLNPRIRVGHEYTVQGRTVDQVVYSVEALSKATYERMFKWLIARINKALETKTSRTHFIGVLDIAGFEIFKVCSRRYHSGNIALMRFRSIPSSKC